MIVWQRWIRRPKSLWLRKALFQVHLWTGIALGLYIFVISVSGSAIVFRNELYTSLWPGPRIVPILSHRLTHDELRDAARRAYPDYRVSWVWDARDPKQAIEIWLDRKGHKKQRFFDPYTGRDLGESHPYSIQFMAWLLDLHVNLLAGKTGRLVNGARRGLRTGALAHRRRAMVARHPDLAPLAGDSAVLELEAVQLAAA